MSSLRAAVRWGAVALAASVILASGAARARANPADPTTRAPGAAALDSVASDSATAIAGAAAPQHDYMAEVRANFTPENRRYWMTRTVLDLVSPFYGIAIGLYLLFSGLSARIRDLAHRRAGNRYARMLIYFTIYSVIGFLLTLPLSWFDGYLTEHQYALSTQSFGGWLGDEFKGLLVSVLFLGGTGLVALAYRAIEKSPKRWWLWLAAGSVPVIVIAVLIQPLLIDPLFNKFTPLKDQTLKTQILDLASKAGIPSRKVFEANKSAQTKKYNAYVTGFGASQRIVLWDTTLKGMSTDEILFVMGHEMGHYRLGHIWKGIAFSSLLSVFLFFFSGNMMSWALARFGRRWGVTEIFDIATLPLFAIALSIVSLVVQPAVNAYDRSVEHEADMFGLEVTHSNDAAARAFIKLGSQNKSNPEPPLLLKWFEFTHPPLVERVRFAQEYHPWTEGQPNRAFHPVR